MLCATRNNAVVSILQSTKRAEKQQTSHTYVGLPLPHLLLLVFGDAGVHPQAAIGVLVPGLSVWPSAMRLIPPVWITGGVEQRACIKCEEQQWGVRVQTVADRMQEAAVGGV